MIKHISAIASKLLKLARKEFQSLNDQQSAEVIAKPETGAWVAQMAVYRNDRRLDYTKGKSQARKWHRWKDRK